MSKRKFKIGDEVVIKPESVYAPKKTKGTVIGYYDKKYTVKFTNGFVHSFRGVKLDAYVEEPKKQVHNRKYKVGDRVIAGGNNINSDKYVGKVGTIVEILEADYGFPYQIAFDDYDGCKIWCSVKSRVKEEPKKTESKNTIVIYQRDRDVVAHDKTTGKKCYAHCHPDDKFDFKTGATIAFDRLIGVGLRDVQPKEEEEIKFLEEFEKGKVYIFDKEVFGKYYGEHNFTWVDYCDGKIVDVSSEYFGSIGEFGITPKWCREVSKFAHGDVVEITKPIKLGDFTDLTGFRGTVEGIVGNYTYLVKLGTGEVCGCFYFTADELKRVN